MTRDRPTPDAVGRPRRGELRSDGLPGRVRGCLFDMDGVITRTDRLHAAAWENAFNRFLVEHRPAGDRRLFDIIDDYDRYVDGKSRLDGVRSFLSSRSIRVPEGAVDDPPGAPTIAGIANAKHDELVRTVRRQGVPLEPGIVDYLHEVRKNGRSTALVTSSADGAEMVERAGVRNLFDVRIDGREAARLGLAGKPDPATFIEATRRLCLIPAEVAMFEDAIAGVQAGRAGGFGVVVGVARTPSRMPSLEAAERTSWSCPPPT